MRIVSIVSRMVDVDNPDDTFTPATIVGTIGTFAIDAGGNWTFTANDAFDALNSGDSVGASRALQRRLGRRHREQRTDHRAAGTNAGDQSSAPGRRRNLRSNQKIMMCELQDIYYRRHRTNETIKIEIKRYAVDDKPTCLSFVGGGDIKPEVCKLLVTEKYGTIKFCAFSGDVLNYYEDTGYEFLLKPSGNCPLWKA